MDKYSLQNLNCANCAVKIEEELNKTEGVNFASINFATLTLAIDTKDIAKVAEVIKEVEPGVLLKPHSLRENAGNLRIDVFLWLRMSLAIVLFLIGLFFYDELHNTPSHIAEYLVLVPAYIISGYPVLINAARNILNGKIFDEHFLMSLATGGAWIIHETPEAVGVMIFYMIGEYLQDISVKRSRSSIQTLLAIRPDTANLVRVDQTTELVSVDVVKPGEKIIVRPGDRVPLDGEISHGNSFFDTSALTGESIPHWLGEGDEVLAGMINQTALIYVKVMRTSSESSISRILDLVENASQRKAVTERFITRFARYYTPVVVILAAGIALLPPLFIPNATFNEWIYRALVVLVISCPCALVVSIPMGYFGGIGAASKRGILVKGSNFLDILADVKTVIFDKTGTLTKGVFKVVEVTPINGRSAEDILNIAAEAEAYSSHPIAQSIRSAVNTDTIRTKQTDLFEEKAGLGIKLISGDKTILVGNDKFMHQENINHSNCDAPGTVLHIAEQGEYVGFITIDDELRSDSMNTIIRLREMGVEKQYMLTGDREEKAKIMAERLSLDGYVADLLPGAKVEAFEKLAAESVSNHKIAFVGDGINDAPVITRSDVGFAMGAMGSEAAIESADVVVLGESPLKIAEAIEIGRRTRKIVWQNIYLAIGIKALFILLGVSGESSMWEAVFADMGVALIAIFNSARLVR
jgi:Zn2+/Cd2+-exporting ATPase